jgi:hypothetical protein
MIISPPFLSSAELPVYDEPCVSQAMPGGYVGAGAFPVSGAMGWHGGIHIHAPTADEPVRAIADGVVIFRRDGATIQYADKDTSTRCVVIRHTTEIGATDDGKPVEFVYYSISMHLSKLDDKLPAVGKPIYRKDKLGLAGKIHGASPCIHFEIVAGDKDTEALTGRKTGRISLQSDGRWSVVYGTSYVFVPSGAAYFSGATAPSSKPGVALAAATGNTTEDLVIGIRYAEGGAYLDSYQLSGTPIGTESEPDKSEYRLYDRCGALHKESGVASPSDWLEMLRFGRKLGPDVFPTTAPHWRKVKLPDGMAGWIDLNATNTKKYSDGDFPHFMGWRLVDDDSTDDNSRCESKAIERLLNTKPDGDPVEADTPRSRMQRLSATDVQAKLAKTICKFPSEWVADDVSTRWKWITEPGNPYNPVPADAKGFDDMQAYAKALCFWADLPAADKDRLTTKHWHFHPREFIIQMRRCGWLSKKEFTQVLPSHALRTGQYKDASGVKQKGVFWEGVTGPDKSEDVKQLIDKHLTSLNRTMRKYGINTPLRKAGFFGNAVQESGWLSSLQESGGSGYWYTPWHGRGFLQLTHASNYFAYWEWRGRVIPAALKKEVGDAAAKNLSVNNVLL